MPSAASRSSSASSGTWSRSTSSRRTPRGRSRVSNQPDVPQDAETPAGRYYSRGIPYLPLDGYPGKLIAVEGTDGVGRSTQIQLLREWLEIKGYGVAETGWKRAPRMQPTLEL